MSRFTRPGKNLSKKSASRRRRHIRVRKKITGTTLKPRLVVTRSLRNVSVQVIDDLSGKTLAYASSIEEGMQEIKQHKQKLLVKKLQNVQLLLALRMLCLIAPDASTTDESLL